MATNENLIQIAVDRAVTTLDDDALIYALTGAGLDAVIKKSNLTGQIENDIGTRFFQPMVFESTIDVSTGDGAYNGILIPAEFDGWNLTYARARVITAGVTGSTTIQIANVTDGVDMLSTKLTILTTAVIDDGTVVIDTTKDDVATDDLLRIDVDTVSTTKPKGLIVSLGFTRP